MTTALTNTLVGQITTVSPAPDYKGMFDVLLNTCAANTRKQYEHTFNSWIRWCANTGTNPNEMTAINVMKFLYYKPLAHRTRKARLSHFRTFLNKMQSLDGSDRLIEIYHNQLCALKLSIDDSLVDGAPPPSNKRKGQRLDANRVHELINNYPTTKNGKPYMRGLRNRAMLAVLFYAGLRRFEVAKLRWEDIDFEREHIHVVGGKARVRTNLEYVPFIGSIARHLLAWREQTQGREFLFPRILKGDHIGEDKPITDDGLYKQFSVDFAPHDARRTLISDLLDSGTYIGDVRAIARHANEATTLIYALPHKTSEIKARVKLGY